MPGKKHDHKPGIYPRGRDSKGREKCEQLPFYYTRELFTVP
ncbi:hypothetical protein TAMC210_02710 [Thermanaeromonas sp. C210]|nr:hypothetical protein TAMC210_02710 [Thermanaeromonas sp. C210]